MGSESKSRGFAGSCWWRWTRYELRDGCIRPAPGAELRVYDPWRLWLKTRPIGRRSDAGAGSPTPYRALLEILRNLKYQGETEDAPRWPPMRSNQISRQLNAESERAVLDWCAKYGLLGILPHRVPQVTLWPVGANQTQYIRVGRGWLAITRDPRNPATPPMRSGAVVQSMFGAASGSEPLSTTWARFFPDTPAPLQESFAYPMPPTKPFWEAYCEPLEEFLDGARALKFLLDGIELSKDSNLRAFQSLSGGPAALADSLLAPMGLGVRVSPRGKTELNYAANSLLAALTLMLLEDLSRGRVLKCPCGQLFVSSAYQARYCSQRCRWRFEQRKFRSARTRKSRSNSLEL